MANVVWAVRHGQRIDQVEPNWFERADRPHDPGLTETGFSQAERTATRFAETEIDAVYASPFLRTVQTASVIADELDLSIKLEDGFGEQLNPEWFDDAPERLTKTELAERFSEIDSEYESRVRPTYPEPGDQALERVANAIRYVVEDESKRILVVGHGHTIAGVVYGLTGLDASDDAPLCGITKLVDAGDEWRIALSDDTSHLNSNDEPSDVDSATETG